QLLILDEPTNGMDPSGRQEILALARDLASNKGMSLLFSSHLLPDVEAVCEHVLVLGRGELLAAGNIQELKRAHAQAFKLRLKADAERFVHRLNEVGCETELQDSLLRVRLPDGQNQSLLWELAHAFQVQIRYLRPQRSTLEEVFLQA